MPASRSRARKPLGFLDETNVLRKQLGHDLFTTGYDGLESVVVDTVFDTLAGINLFRVGHPVGAWKKRSSTWRNTIILVGPQDVGKTAILSTLVFNRTPRTYTSLQPNSSIISLPSAPSETIRIVDIPGHPRIRDQFAEYLPQARGIVFVVDASTVSRNGAAVAEHLHYILRAITSQSLTRLFPPFLILAHKLDLLKTSGPTGASLSNTAIRRVRTITARELGKRRLAQMSSIGVEGLGEEGEGKDELGELDCIGSKGEFDWDRWEGGRVEFAGTWVDVEDDEDGLAALKEWMATLY